MHEIRDDVSGTGLRVVVLLLCMVVAPLQAGGAFLYKSYTVRYDRGWDILCDPYVVQKNDWVLKLFKQRGEIAHEDFPEFLRIFKRINPHIRDIDRVRPGQHIMIPLKKIKQGTLPGQSSGIVTIPFVTISNVPEAIDKRSAAYEVRKGDCVSVLIARKFGEFGSEAYQDGIKLFKLVNPDIEDIDRIYAGQMVHIPDPSLRKEDWYPSLFGPSNGDGGVGGYEGGLQAQVPAQEPPAATVVDDRPKTPLMEAASILNARLLDKGKYYFPRPGQEDFELELSSMPIIELKDGTRIVFPENAEVQRTEVEIITAYWKRVKVVGLAAGATAEQVFNSVFDSLGIVPSSEGLSFSDRGVDVEARGKWIIEEPSTGDVVPRKVCISLIERPDQRTPESICRYLEQHDIIVRDVVAGPGPGPESAQRETRPVMGAVTIDPSNPRHMVRDFVTALGFQYAPDVSISFPYAGVQIKAVSNLIAMPGRIPLLVDFGDFYGDALAAIEKTGFDIIQIKGEDGPGAIIKKLLTALGLTYSSNPWFAAAKRSDVYNTKLTIPGLLIKNGEGSQTLLSDVPLHDGIVQLLTHQGVRVILLDATARYS